MKSDQDWFNLIEDQKKSNKTIKAFCKDLKITEQSFYNKRRRLSKNHFVNVEVDETDPASFELKFQSQKRKLEISGTLNAFSMISKIFRELS